MTTRGLTVWSADDDSGAEAGIWECTAGPSYWVQEETEVIYLLSGSMTVTPDDGKPVKLGPGDVAVFPRGWRGPWELHETVRKVYVIFKAVPGPESLDGQCAGVQSPSGSVVCPSSIRLPSGSRM